MTSGIDRDERHSSGPYPNLDGRHRSSPVWLQQLDAHDRALLVQLATRRRSPIQFIVWRVLTRMGGAVVTTLACAIPLVVGLLPAVGLTAVTTRTTTALRLGVLTTLVVLLSHLAVQLVKRTVGRPRPATWGGVRALAAEPDRFSFPSGHSAAAMAVALSYAVTLPSLFAVLAVLAILVGLSRAVLGVHYLGDVIAGQLLAALATALVYAAMAPW